MDRLSMEVIFQNLPIEKIWEIRKSNGILKRVIDQTNSAMMKKWNVSALEIRENRIGKSQDFENRSHLVSGIYQTKWLSCEKILVLKNIGIDTLEKSILPVSRRLCKNTLSIEISSNDTPSPEFVNSLFRLLSVCPLLRAASIHLKDLKEQQLSQMLKRVTWRENNEPTWQIILSLNASAEITPKIVSEFLDVTRSGSFRMIFIKKAEEGEEPVKITKEAVLTLFSTTQVTDRRKQEGIVVERMQIQRVNEIFEDLRLHYPFGYTEENGYREFVLSVDGIVLKRFKVLQTF